ncbi:UNVERIFIED_CONTAM: hypothetical protein Sindi_1704600 [Sesamum indicum]
MDPPKSHSSLTHTNTPSKTHTSPISKNPLAGEVGDGGEPPEDDGSIVDEEGEPRATTIAGFIGEKPDLAMEDEESGSIFPAADGNSSQSHGSPTSGGVEGPFAIDALKELKRRWEARFGIAKSCLPAENLKTDDHPFARELRQACRRLTAPGTTKTGAGGSGLAVHRRMAVRGKKIATSPPADSHRNDENGIPPATVGLPTTSDVRRVADVDDYVGKVEADVATHLVDMEAELESEKAHEVSHDVSPNEVSHDVSPNDVSHDVSRDDVSHDISPDDVSHDVSPNDAIHDVSPNDVNHDVSPDDVRRDVINEVENCRIFPKQYRTIPTGLFVGNIPLHVSPIAIHEDKIAHEFNNSSRKTLSFIAPTVENGEIVVRPSLDTVRDGSKRWKNTAVGYFLGKKPYYHHLKEYAHSVWPALREVTATANGFFFFQFKTLIDMEDVIEGGPWLFQGQPIVLQKWKPGMAMRKLQHKHVPIWIKLRHLPMEYWTTDGLTTVASGVGRPLYPDAITRACTRLDFAPVCVMIDVAQTLPKHIIVMTPDENGGETPCKVDVEYEWLPPKCTNCMILGHMTKDCPLNKIHKPSKPPVAVQWLIYQDVGGRMLRERKPDKHDDRGKALVNPRGVLTQAAPLIMIHVEPSSVECSWAEQTRPSACIKGPCLRIQVKFLGILETRVQQNNIMHIQSYLLPQWNWFTDYNSIGNRIWLAWDENFLDVHVLDLGDQFVHCRITSRAVNENVFVTIVYGASEVIDRRILWTTLETLAQQCSDIPWLVGGDFNAVRELNEVCGILGDIRMAIEEFNTGIMEADLIPLSMQGEWFTWHNCSTTARSLWKRLEYQKVDIRKAYDTVEWDFLLAECVSTTSFSIGLNGKPHGFFTGARGLRQGDPLSPYLFVLVMEALHLGFLQRIEQDMQFTYHLKRPTTFKEGLEWFAELSGLWLNVQKSHLIISRSAQELKDQLLEILGFQEGHLPMRYLGLPLISSRLSISDCQPLISKIDARIIGWEGISLSYAGRVQIIKSVLSTLSLYWASAFILPKKVIKEIEKRLRNFLWKGTTSSGYAKVAWKDVCRPADEGGLGFKDISTLNHALMSKKLCDIIQCDRTSIWAQWLYQDRLRDTSIWTVREHGGSWGWRKILRLRPFLRSIVDYQIGNGGRFFVWQDPWHHLGPLIERFPHGPRHLRLEESAKLSSVISAGEWQWPTITDFECLEITHNLPLILGGEDRVIWRCDEGQPTTQTLYRLFDPPEPKLGWSSLLSGS